MQTTAAIPEQRKLGAEPYAATLQHARLLRRKIDTLTETLADAMAQMLTCADREYRAGRIGFEQLCVLYEDVRELGPGFTKIWDAIMSVNANTLRAQRRERSSTLPPAGKLSYWSGPYPYDKAPRPRSGVPVVYVLYDASNEPIYLGSTGDFPGRVRWHRNDGKPIAWWLAYPCDSREAAYLLEGGLLAARKPPLNVKVGR